MNMFRRTPLFTLIGLALAAPATLAAVNSLAVYPVSSVVQTINVDIDPRVTVAAVDKRLFGSNLEWFNDGGGLSSRDTTRRDQLASLAAQSGQTVYRFPGGTLSDYYHWVDGTGPVASRPVRPHYTDPASSANTFGSPEFFSFLRKTGAEGLITVNAGTGTAQEAASWVDYANSPTNTRRAADGFTSPIGVKLWEVGNELYYPGNAGPNVSVTPEVYATRFNEYADAMRRVDPSIKVLALGIADAHGGPVSPWSTTWSETVLRYSASRIDMLAVHNSYFPILQGVQQPPVSSVYPALWAAPEAVDRSLTTLETLIGRYESPSRKIGIAITEWGALFATATSDPYWVDHSKTMGSGVFIARMLQVYMQHPRVQMANHFKFTDNSVLGLVAAENMRAKVPYYVMQMMARNTGNQRIKSTLANAPATYSVPQVGVMLAQNNVPELTQVVTRDSNTGRIYLNLVNRSLTRSYQVKPRLVSGKTTGGQVLQVKASEPTAHNGRDTPSWWGSQWLAAYEPFSSAPENTINLRTTTWTAGSAVTVAPFSVVTVVLNP